MRKIFVLITLAIFFSALIFPQQSSNKAQNTTIQIPQCMKDIAKLMKSKNLNRIVIQSSKEKDVFIGFQYLGKMAMVVYAKVPKENKDPILKNIRAKNYQKAYQLLNVMVGNKVTTISDSEFDTLRISEDSTDFVKTDNKIVFFNPASEKLFKNKVEFENFRKKYNDLYLNCIKEILKKLK